MGSLYVALVFCDFVVPLSSRIVGRIAAAVGVCWVHTAMALTLAKILAKVATQEEVALVGLAEFKLREAGHFTLFKAWLFLCRSGYATVIHLRCINQESGGRFALAPPQPSEDVIDLIIKAVKYADITSQAKEMNVRTCISEKRRWVLVMGGPQVGIA